MRELIQTLQQELSTKTQVVFETNLYSLVRSLVGEGGATLLRMVVVDEVNVVPVSFAPRLHLDLHIAWKSESYLSRANQAFLVFSYRAS